MSQYFTSMMMSGTKQTRQIAKRAFSSRRGSNLAFGAKGAVGPSAASFRPKSANLLFKNPPDSLLPTSMDKMKQPLSMHSSAAFAKQPLVSMAMMKQEDPMGMAVETLKLSMSGSQVYDFQPYGLSPSEFMTVGTAPQLHLLRGLAPFVPSEQVFSAIRERVDSCDDADDEYFFAQAELPAHQLAFYVLDRNQLRARFRLWQQCFPDVIPHYAVKSNPDQMIVEVMAQEFATQQTEGNWSSLSSEPFAFGFDCASMSEIKAVLKAGGKPEHILYANPCKPLSHLEFSKNAQVLRSTFDSACELMKVKMVHPNAEMILRIWTNDVGSQCPLSHKYGAKPSEVVPLLEHAKSLGIKVVGISFHCGSGARLETYTQALKDAKVAFDAGTQIGHPMQILDIGGGFPGVDERHVNMAQIAASMRPLLDRDWKGVCKIAEPGRFFSASIQTLATQVIGKRVRPSEKLGGDIRREYYLNEGLYQSFNCMIYDHSSLIPEKTIHEADVDLLRVGQNKLVAPTHASKVFGQTCDGLDTISEEIFLPDLRVGDWLVVPVMGAYTNGAASNFNGFATNPVIYV